MRIFPSFGAKRRLLDRGSVQSDASSCTCPLLRPSPTSGPISARSAAHRTTRGPSAASWTPVWCKATPSWTGRTPPRHRPWAPHAPRGQRRPSAPPRPAAHPHRRTAHTVQYGRLVGHRSVQNGAALTPRRPPRARIGHSLAVVAAAAGVPHRRGPPANRQQTSSPIVRRSLTPRSGPSGASCAARGGAPCRAPAESEDRDTPKAQQRWLRTAAGCAHKPERRRARSSRSSPALRVEY